MLTEWFIVTKRNDLFVWCSGIEQVLTNLVLHHLFLNKHRYRMRNGSVFFNDKKARTRKSSSLHFWEMKLAFLIDF